MKPWGVARAPSGSIFVSDGGKLRRVDPGRAAVTVATVAPAFEIGPVAVTPNGDVVYATAYALYRLRGGKPARRSRIAPGTILNGSHGIAVASDGSLLVSDTDSNRIVRVTGDRVTTFATLGHPRGIDIARNGTVYVAAADAHRIARYSATGKRLGFVGPRFDDPYALSVAEGRHGLRARPRRDRDHPAHRPERDGVGRSGAVILRSAATARRGTTSRSRPCP